MPMGGDDRMLRRGEVDTDDLMLLAISFGDFMVELSEIKVLPLLDAKDEEFESLPDPFSRVCVGILEP